MVFWLLVIQNNQFFKYLYSKQKVSMVISLYIKLIFYTPTICSLATKLTDKIKALLKENILICHNRKSTGVS